MRREVECRRDTILRKREATWIWSKSDKVASRR